jgi:glycosyltransferase involved in cell wall biosynthesis
MMMKGKKVLLSAYACSPFRGSEPGNGWSWATNLAAKGLEVWCFTNTEDEKEITEATDKLGLPNLHFVFIKLENGLDEFLLDTDSKKIYFHYLLWQKKAAKVAKKLHDSIHFDIGHHVTFGSLQQGTFLWKLKDIKIIFGPVGGGQVALALLKEYFGKEWKTEKLRSVISLWSTRYSKNFRKTLLAANYVLVTNHDTLEMAREVKNTDPAKIIFVPDTAVPKVMEMLEPIVRPIENKLKLLWVGRMLPRKGLNLILEALAHVPPDVDYSLTIVGGGEQFHLIDQWVNKFGIDKSKLIVLGQIPFIEVIEHYKKADAFIFCSLRDSFAAQLTEAMAFGLPIIALNIHGVTIGVPDNCGIKITPVTKEGTLKDIAAAITTMHSNPAFRQQCSDNAFNYSKTNTWHNRVNTVIEKYY